MALPMKMPSQYEMVTPKKSFKLKNAIFEKASDIATKIPSASAVKENAVVLAKKTATATKERAKARGVAASEITAGGLCGGGSYGRHYKNRNR